MPSLQWIGKEKVINHHKDVPFQFLDHQYSFVDGKKKKTKEPISNNKIIHGDNLLALKSLLPEYEGKIKCISIDPPYNTGNENWIYNDNVNDPRIRKWLSQVVGKEGEDLSRHDKWLCMMYPRLKLLHKLLSDDGAIFISIDDKEASNLKLLMNEIFGENNFIVQIIWKKRSTPPNDQIIGTIHDYILAYSKDKNYLDINLKKRSEDQLNRYKNPDKHPKGPWAPGDLMANVKGGRYVKSLNFPIKNPITGEEHYPSSNGNWRFNSEKINELINKNEIYFGDDNRGRPKLKRFLCDVKEGVTYSSIWDFVPFNQNGSKEMSDILGNMNIFDSPKPSGLIEELLLLGTNSESIVLDSFAGTGTTAHAVLNLNAQDGGNRKFILIEMEEYAETITAERIKRVIGGYGEGKNKVEGTGGDFDFFELGEPLFVDGNINPKVSLEKIKEYVYYMETKQPTEHPNSKENSYYMGVFNDTAYYFFYNTKEETSLDYSFLKTIQTKSENYIIYASTCLLTKEFLIKNKITFKKIPKDIPWI
ncbi:MAG: site-specific DNA-methyltransferase [Leptospiraceae bacterium]|nr:site-specific DNA-methyltransferase [Leptospiraceae bacterium]